MGEPHIIRTPSGDEMVVVTRAEYEALLAVAEEAQEDAEDLAVARRRWGEWNDSGRHATPPDVARRILDGQHVLEAFRHHCGMSIDELAGKSGVGSTHIREIEARTATCDERTASALAGALGVEAVWLVHSAET